VGLSDDLGKLDQFVEAVTRKVAAYLGEVLEDQRDKLHENLTANNSKEIFVVLVCPIEPLRLYLYAYFTGGPLYTSIRIAFCLYVTVIAIISSLANTMYCFVLLCSA